MTKSPLKISLLKAIIATLLFLLIYKYANIQIVQNYTKDKSFDFINSFVIEDLKIKTNSPSVMLFGIDDYYLKSQKLIDDKNNTTYGYIFPNDKIAKFIERVDTHCQKLPKTQQPKALFIDYDFSFTSAVYGQRLTEEDNKIVEALKKERSYTILLPKTSDYNFIESSTDKVIQQLIQDKKILFVSVPLTESKDFKTRRYVPYNEYRNSQTGSEHNYTIASLALWQLSNSERNITHEFKQQHTVENRFIVKSYQESLFKANSNHIQKPSSWQELTYYSANYPFGNIPKENFQNALILLGATYNSSLDKFTTNSSKNPQLSGVEVLANALMTHFYLEGKFKQFNLYIGLIVVFIIYFLSCLVTDRVLGITPNQVKILLVKKEISKITISLFLSMVLMVILSVVTLLYYQEWFDWGGSLILFGSSATVWGVIEFIIKLKKEKNWMKKLIGVLFIIGFLSAGSLVVKDANVTVTIDNKEQKLQKDEKLEVEQGSKVCFKEGKGRIVIDDQLQISSESNVTCQILSKEKKFDFEAWFKKNIHKVALLFGNVKEQVKLAVTRKGDECEVVTGIMVLKLSDEYLVIRNECWSPLPINLKILDENNITVKSFINEDDDISLFIVPREVLKDGYRVVGYDGFNEVLVNIEVKL